MGRRRTLAVTDTPGGLFLAWLAAFMIYVAVLSVSALLVLHDAAGAWRRDLTGTLTIQLAASGDAEADERRVAAALSVARSTPGVRRATAMTEDEVLDLVAPWLSSGAVAADLPLPRLIDVEAAPGREMDTAHLVDRLRVEVPEAAVDDHGVWLKRLVSLFYAAEVLAGFVVLLIVSVTIGAVLAATRSGLAVQVDTIEVLHLMGAQDDDIARQFAHRAGLRTLTGGVLGLAVSLASVLGIGALAARVSDGAAIGLAWTGWQWTVLGGLPLIMAAVAWLTAYLTVLQSLRRSL